MNKKVKTKMSQANTPFQKKGSSTCMKVFFIILVAVISLVALIGFSIEKGPEGIIDKSTTVCIAGAATLYATEWCGYCKIQKELFGINIDFLNIIDCDKERDSCIEAGITVFPTWIINGEKYTGVKTEDQLKELSKC